ncbi:DHS-like NAD/FAD-binding domain-containing protein, partial [Dioszegia hungarica]
AKNIVVLTGAGISTSAGIPDFRSPETGLYANLERLNLPFPEAVFELGYFKKNPVPFWTLAKDLYPGKYLPTPTHYFLTLLHRRSVLLRTFTQNIDTLETLASLPPEKIIEAHGSFASAHCLSCEKEVSREYVLEAGVRDGKVVKCDEEGCRGLVKPDIVFFGEGLPERFFEHMGDLKKADLVIVIGTSLQVQPFASLAQYCRPGTPRLLINREAVGPFAPPRRKTGKESLGTLLSQLGISESDVPELESSDDEAAGGYDYSFWKGDSDEGIRRLAKELGWEEELDEMIKEGHEALRAKWRE